MNRDDFDVEQNQKLFEMRYLYMITILSYVRHTVTYSETCIKQALKESQKWLLKTCACLMQVNLYLF